MLLKGSSRDGFMRRLQGWRALRTASALVFILATGCAGITTHEARLRNAIEDWDVWLRVALAGAEFVPVMRVGAYYRRHAGTVSTQRARMQSRNAARFLKSQGELRERPDVLRRWGLSLADVQRRQKPLLQEARLTVAYDLRKQGDYRGCLVSYLRSIRWGGWSREAVRGLLKLGPQFVLGR